MNYSTSEATQLLVAASALSLPLYVQTAQEYEARQSIESTIADTRRVEPSDVDGDGLLDLVGYSAAHSELSWLRNRGTGSLGTDRYDPARTLVKLPSGAAFLAGMNLFEVADLNGDGLDDYLLNVFDTPAVQVITNLGGGSVAAPVTIIDQTGNGNYIGSNLETLDVDGDGDLDLIALSRFSFPGVKRLQYFENVGGTLVERAGVLPPASEVDRLAGADIDGDGDVDLAVYNPVNHGWLRNNGGVFSSFISVPTPSGSEEMPFAEDLDGDGDIDLAFIDGERISIYENIDGLGTFGSAVRHTLSGEIAGLLDMDGDGVLDAVRTSAPVQQLGWTEILPGFALGADSTLGPAGLDTIASVQLTDVDGDGLQDALLLQASNRISVVQGQTSTGQLALDSTVNGVSRSFPSIIRAAAADFDLDGDLDLITAQFGGGLKLLVHDGNGGFLDPQALPMPPNRVLDLVVADLTGDGFPDVLTAAFNGRLFLHVNVPGGGFNAPVQIGPPNNYSYAAAVDLDQDGDLDIVAGPGTTGTNIVAHDQVAPGQFATNPRTLATFQGFVREVNLADLDRDGLDDLIATVLTVGTDADHFLCRALGDGTVDSSLLQSTSSTAPLQPADIDGDGAADLLWLDPSSEQLRARVNLGGFQFSPSFSLLGIGPLGSTLLPSQLNTDGIADLVLTGALDPDRQLVRAVSQGFNDYGPLGTLECSAPATSPLVLVDLDQDGDVDIIGGSSGEGTLAVFRSTYFSRLGTSECGPAVPNSTGAPGVLSIIGSLTASDSALRVIASSLPPLSLTLFLASRDSNFVVGPGGSAGNLCLGGEVGRFLGPGEAQQSSLSGSSEVNVNLRMVPQPTGAVGALAGDSWVFQAWNRDAVGGSVTSNFTQAVRVLLR